MYRIKELKELKLKASILQLSGFQTKIAQLIKVDKQTVGNAFAGKRVKYATIDLIIEKGNYIMDLNLEKKALISMNKKLQQNES